MTNYRVCPLCDSRRLLVLRLDGMMTRVCFSCFKVQPWKKMRRGLAMACFVLCAAGPVPTFAAQVVLDKDEFVRHLQADKTAAAERTNLAKQNGLLREQAKDYREIIALDKTYQGELEASLEEAKQVRESLQALQSLTATQLREAKAAREEVAWREVAIGSVVAALVPPAWRWLKLLRWR